ncbi:disease resistance RPP13-like protein 4 [Prunus yedoensis var. nudiflora]|uniref:Disease resistance RPP13-like protein 4 n=1 Tax=Prunus yedoensis var. nudiflora TaxID=2094558 RepID=A0A314UQU3_PRUYE|nr:disease resistance RPP13-like protein 4 [Prunus yedoensis var. nudiflora]
MTIEHHKRDTHQTYRLNKPSHLSTKSSSSSTVVTIGWIFQVPTFIQVFHPARINRAGPLLFSVSETRVEEMLIVDSMIQTLTEQVFKALVNQSKFSLEFSGQFKQMKTGLDLARALLADTENLNHKNETVRAGLSNLKEVIYKADDVLTDCLVRDEYGKMHPGLLTCFTIHSSIIRRADHEEHPGKVRRKCLWFWSYQILRKIQGGLKGKRCLIVMDDVWSHTEVDWWTNLCSVLPEQNSCIIITTRNEDAAISMGVESSRIHRPNTLNDDESWSLFSKFAFSSSRGICPDDQFENLGKELLKKCGGLPLAIKTIGSLLASKINSPSQWRDILESFHALTTEGKASSVMASLRLSYDELPPFLKQCMLCFSIYREDAEISADQLIHWWVGEGLVQGKGQKQQ